MFCITVCTQCIAFVRDCDGFRLYFWLQNSSSSSYCILFYYVLSCLSLPCRCGGGRAARRDRRPQELLGHASTRLSFLLHLCLLVLSIQQLWDMCFYNSLDLNALPVHLLRQVYFFSLFSVFFWCLFSVPLFGGLGDHLRGHWVDLGVIWGAFGFHFCDFSG